MIKASDFIIYFELIGYTKYLQRKFMVFLAETYDKWIREATLIASATEMMMVAAENVGPRPRFDDVWHVSGALRPKMTTFFRTARYPMNIPCPIGLVQCRPGLLESSPAPVGHDRPPAMSIFLIGEFSCSFFGCTLSLISAKSTVIAAFN